MPKSKPPTDFSASQRCRFARNLTTAEETARDLPHVVVDRRDPVGVGAMLDRVLDQVPMSNISSSFIPRVVTAGVPSRMLQP